MKIEKYFLEILEKYNKAIYLSLFFSITFVAFFDRGRHIFSLNAFKVNMSNISLVGMAIFYLLSIKIFKNPKYTNVKKIIKIACVYILILRVASEIMMFYDMYIFKQPADIPSSKRGGLGWGRLYRIRSRRH